MTTTNFDSGSLNYTPSSTSATYDGWTFGTSASAIDFANYSKTEWSTMFNQSGGRSIFFIGDGHHFNGGYYFKSSGGSDFQLNSFNISYSESPPKVFTIAGYRDNNLIVAPESVDLATVDTTGNITYTTVNKMGTEYGGLLTLNAAFNNVDEIRFQIPSDNLLSFYPEKLSIDDIDISAAVVTPSIISATYDASTNSLVVTGTNMVGLSGATNDIDVSKLTLTGQNGATYTLTSPNVDITTATQFTVALNATDQINIEGLLNKNGTASVGTTTYNIAAAADWNPAQSGNADTTGNAVTVSNVQTPAMTSATYDASTGILIVTGSNLVKASGAINDIDASLLTFTGEGGSIYTLTDTSDVEITSGTAFTVTLSSTDKTAVNQIINKNGTSSTGATTYNLAANDDWNTVIGNTDISDMTGNGITVSNVVVPTITSTTYDANTGVLAVTGIGFLKASGSANDIDVSKFTFTGEGGAAYTLTDSADVEITSGTAFTVTLSSTDKSEVNQIINKNGAGSTGATTYNLAAAEDWAAGADASVNVIDATSNGITVSNVATPTITSATYDASTGALAVTGVGFLKASGSANDIDVSKFTFTGEGGATYTLNNSADVEITSGTAFTVTLSSTDKSEVNQIINKNGASSTGATTYNLATAEDWAAGADASVNVIDATSNGITVSNVATPTITSTTYDASTGALAVTGVGFLKASGSANDIDVSKFTFTGEGGSTYTLTDSADVEITSGTSFTVTLSTTDKAGVNQIVNKNGTASTNGTTYNLAAAEDWAAGANASVNVVDATGNGITASNVALPTITSATYSTGTGVLVVTGSGFLKASGATNDIDVSKFTFTGEGGATYTLNNSTDVEITSGTAFTITLSSTDKTAVNLLLNKNGTSSTDATIYNLAAAEDWAAGADAMLSIADLNSNAITATLSVSSSGSGGTGGGGASTTTKIIDGVVVQTTIQSNGAAVTTVPIVTAERKDDPASLFSDHADIPVSTNASGKALLTFSLPIGVGLSSTGLAKELNLTDAKAELIQRIEQKTGVNTSVSQETIEHAKDFLSSLAANEQVTVRVATPTISDSRVPDMPIIITGSNLADDSKQILVIDTRNLLSGTIIQLDNVAFASVIGAGRFIGGTGENFATGDDHNQFMVLGADNDILFGGGGDDTIGSLGGNDQTFGDAGNDIVFGGAGNDYMSGGVSNDRLNGGLGFDHAIQSGVLKDYIIEIKDNVVVLKNANGEIDSFSDVELINFTDGTSLAVAYSDVEAAAHYLAKNWLGRDLTTNEGDFVQNWMGASIDDLLAVYRTLPEAAKTADKSNEELLAGLKDNPNIIRLDFIRNLTVTEGNDEGYLPLGVALNVDGGKGVDVLKMAGKRDESHLEFNGELELTQLSDGAMLKLTNAEMITYDSGESVVFAHNPLEGTVARLVHSFFNRDVTADEWRLGIDAMNHQVSFDDILAWFKDHANMQNLSNAEYINTIYHNTLGRDASIEELSANLSRLDASAVTRESLAAEIAQSDEASTHLIGSVMLHEGWI